ncbi:MAG TPA: GAF domain-containing protein, partial [Anaerolineae bacterium]|nr:GAF domain-containing protein [Anaerolineae bacterium]
KIYLTEARFCYEQQGALAKIRDLEERHPNLLVHTPAAPIDGGQTRVSTHETTATALDFMAVLKAAQAISGEIVLDTLLEQLLHIVIEHAGAQKGFLIVEKDGRLVIEVTGAVEQKEIAIHRAITLDLSQQLPLAVVNYVKRTSESLVIGDAENDSRFAHDPYVAQYKPKSILCLPILSQGKLTEILYLENNLATDAFTPDRIEIMQILSAQAAISLENARLYNEMSQEMADRMRAEQALRAVTKGTAAVTGSDFFCSLVYHLAAALQVPHALVAECTDAAMTRVRTLCLLQNNEFTENIEYDLAGTPCQTVVRGTIAYYPEKLAELFPGEVGLEGYLGVPIRDSAN